MGKCNENNKTIVNKKMGVKSHLTINSTAVTAHKRKADHMAPICAVIKKCAGTAICEGAGTVRIVKKVKNDLRDLNNDNTSLIEGEELSKKGVCTATQKGVGTARDKNINRRKRKPKMVKNEIISDNSDEELDNINLAKKIKPRKMVFKSMAIRIARFHEWAVALSREHLKIAEDRGWLLREVMHRDKWRKKGRVIWEDTVVKFGSDSTLITNRTQIEQDHSFNISLYVRIEATGRTILLIDNIEVIATHLIKYYNILVGIEIVLNIMDNQSRPSTFGESTRGNQLGHQLINSITEAEDSSINILDLPLTEQLRCLQASINKGRPQDNGLNAQRALSVATYATGRYAEMMKQINNEKTNRTLAQRIRYIAPGTSSSQPTMAETTGRGIPAKSKNQQLYPVVVKFDEHCDPDANYRAFRSMNYDGILVTDTRYYKDYKEVVQYFDTIVKAISAIKTIRINISELEKINVKIWDVGLRKPQMPRLYISGIDPPSGFNGWQDECLEELVERNKSLIRLNKELANFKVIRKIGRSVIVQMEWACAHAAISQGYLHAYNTRCNVEIYYDVKQCYNCLQYGHITATCQNGRIKGCLRCANPGHQRKNCQAPRARCINCLDDVNNDHLANSNRCPARIRAVDEAKKRTTEYPEWVEETFFEKKRLNKPEPFKRANKQKINSDISDINEQSRKMSKIDKIETVKLKMNAALIRNTKRVISEDDTIIRKKRSYNETIEVTRSMEDIRLQQQQQAEIDMDRHDSDTEENQEMENELDLGDEGMNNNVNIIEEVVIEQASTNNHNNEADTSNSKSKRRSGSNNTVG